ncbi:MAG TPA: RimK/LysX family protein [Pirellulales bacterium]|nr:RimK/LysX family protein [Pirellulales bacterium]
MHALPTIGWREWLALPDLHIGAVKAKVDTGARSSALHAFDIEPFERDGRPMVRFSVHPWQHNSSHSVAAEAELIGQRLVRNSGGLETLRPVIVTSARLFGECWPIEVTLIGRDAMGFRLLLGREAVRRRFLVDASRSFLAGKRPAGVPRTPRRERKLP